MGIVESLAMALSLCADCFAVSLCSSVTLRKICWKDILKVAVAFAVIQTGLLTVGWLFGHMLVGLVTKISAYIGFLLLLYVGGSMVVEGIKGEEEIHDLNGLKNVVLGGIATSIDALAVGVARSMDGSGWREVSALIVSVFVVTALSVISGIFGGNALGCKFGRVAEIVGGLVLVGIGVSVLIGTI